MNIDLEQLKKMIEDLKPKPIDFKPLNDFIEKGGKTNNLHMATSDIQFKDIPTILTTQGVINIMYNPHIPKDTYYLFNPPKLEDAYKLDFDLSFARPKGIGSNE